MFLCIFCSSFLEREDWFYTLSRTVSEHERGSVAFNRCSGEVSNISLKCSKSLKKGIVSFAYLT